MQRNYVSEEDVETFQRDGVVLIKGLFADYVDLIRTGIEQNLREPGTYAAENLQSEDTGRFFDDYCNWQRIPAFRTVVEESPAARVAAELTRSKNIQIFHDHVLIKEPGTSKATPWHQDSPYYFIEGQQTVSFWSPMDPVTDATLRCVAGSHRWKKSVLPTRWLSEEAFYPNPDDYLAVPDPDAENMSVREWPMEPGDAVAFHYAILHGARGNHSDQRRRAFSLRFLGDDARYTERPGRTSPPFPGHNMQAGDRLREDWFPIVYRETN